MGAYGPHKGKGRIIVVAERAALEMALARDAVLVVSANPKEGHNLDVYRGEGLAEKTPILENAFASGLGARGYQVGDDLVFCFIYQAVLRYLQVANHPATEPQGPPFFMSQVSLDEGFFSSDLLVTPDGDVLVLGYFAVKGSFQPRLFILPATSAASPQGSPSGFEEIPLGPGGGVYLDGVFGSPRMRIVPEVIDGKVRIFAVKQLSSL